ncbi:MAG: GEVED domain-containing protein [Salibacteraceae bacterium]
MKRSQLLAITTFAVIIGTIVLYGPYGKENNQFVNNQLKRIKYEQFINAHQFNRRVSSSDLDKIPKKDRPDLAFEQNFLATMDPATGKPEIDRLFPVMEMTKKLQQNTLRTPGSATSPWVERGPNNVAGRTRAIAWDPTSTNKVWAGGVSGGLWYNSNITSSSSSWVSVNDFWDNISVSAIAFDPNNSNIIYVATGESYANANRGAGIWKSTNGGNSFSQLSSTSSFYYINDMVVRNESGTSVIYAAVSRAYYGGSWQGAGAGLQRSTNGGTSWNQVMPNVSGSALVPTDLDIASDNQLWVGTGDNAYGNGGGRVYASTNGTTYSLKHTHSSAGRVTLACAPSNANYVYALFEYNSELDAIKVTTNDGTTWSSKSEPNDADPGIPSNDFTRGQAWYDLTIDVDPLNMNTVLIGGIDLFKTTNGGTSWTQITHWYGGFGYDNVHADQHAIVYKPGSSSKVIFGNDGGVAYSSNMNQSNPTTNHRNKDYNVTQYYACAIHPTAGSNSYLAGSQDNGTQQYSAVGMNSTTEVMGGDGAFCHIDQTNGSYQSAQYVYNVVDHSTNGFSTSSAVLNDQNTGRFINPSDLDDNQNILYLYRTLTSLYKITGFQSGSPVSSTVNISTLYSSASCLKVSPYTTSSSTLFVGTTSGRLFKITNANGSPTKTEITGNSFPTGSISCIEFGQNESQIIVTFSNYGVSSVWYTTNGGSSWTAKEGNLPDMPIRWALFNPLNYNEVILATEVGVWASTNFSQSNPTWTASNSGLANCRVDMLQLRTSDNQVIAATHGRGLFSSDGFTGGGGPTSYCTATSSSVPCDEYISNVTIGTINNTTACGNYSDYTSQSVSMTAGASVPISISTAQVGGTNAGYTDDQVAVWIDWNNDGDFTDAGEEVYTVTYSATTTFPLTASINVPANVLTANVRMRVRMSYLTTDGQITPCGTSTWGEVEDYSVSLIGAAPSICGATSTENPCDEYISNVTIGTINNTTTCGNYSDFTSQITNVSQGATVPMSISTGIVGATTAGYTDDQVAVWVDWNNDLDFSDPGEEVYSVTYSSTTTFPLSFNVAVPSNAFLGNVRMRVRMSYLTVDGPITPCGNSQWGEVEDYQLNVIPGSILAWTNQPGTINIECDESILPANTGNATASTTCAGSAFVTYQDVTTLGICANTYSISRKWTAIDGCGASESYFQIINVSDVTDPVVICPPNQTIISPDGIIANMEDFTNLVTVTDNCTSPSSIVLSQFPPEWTPQIVGTIGVDIQATDLCWNSGSCHFEVEIIKFNGIGEIDLSSIAFYPIPLENKLTIDLGNYQKQVTYIKVYNAVGQTLFENTSLNGNSKQVIDASHFSNGVIFIQIGTANKYVIKRVLKI